MRAPTLLLTTLLLVAGCSKTKPSDICARRAVTACSFLYNCCDDLERYQLADLDRTNPTLASDVFGGNGLSFIVQVESDPSQSGCENVYTAQCNAAFSYLDAATDQGRVTIDEAATEACLKPLEDALDACEPNAFFNYDPDKIDGCKKQITGTVVGGGDCYDAVECAAEGSVCEPTPQMSQGPDAPMIRKLNGVCKAPPQQGQECADRQCAPSLVCDGTNHCVARTGLNGDCSMIACQADLYCDQANRCQAAPGSGQPCAMGQCGPDLVCRDQTCRPATVPTVHQYCDGL